MTAPPYADAAVETDAEAGRRAVGVDLAVVGDEVVLRILGRDAALQGEPVQRHLVLRRQGHLGIVQAAPLGDQDLGSDDVDAGDHLRDRVLDLDARIDLDEEPLARVRVEQELDRAGVVVAGRRAEPHRRVADRVPDGRVEPDGRRHLDDLLVPPLHRAVALVEMEHVAVPVAQDLDLDVRGVADVALEEDRAVAERGGRLAAGLLEARRPGRRVTRRRACRARRRRTPP